MLKEGLVFLVVKKGKLEKRYIIPYSQKGKLEEGISPLVVKKVS
jgi:hypothetical protein